MERFRLLKVNKNKKIKEEFVIFYLYKKDIACLYKTQGRYFIATINGYFHEIVKESFIEVFGKNAF